MKPSYLTIALLIGVALALPLQAATYHVAQGVAGASDDNAGTEATPWKTIGKAAQTVQPGDAVLIHAGRYAEAVAVRAEGTPRAPITFAAFGDDEVVLDGADVFGPERWQPVAGSDRIFSAPVPADPGQIFVDGKPLYMKVERLAADNWRLGKLTDADVNLWQYDAEKKALLLNLGGGNPAANHRIEIPVRAFGVTVGANCRVRGLNLTRYASFGLGAWGDDGVIEDCRITDCGGGVTTSGWDRRGVIIRRNTIIGCLGNGINLQDRPSGCVVQDNLVIRCTLNPWHAILWSGSVKMNSAADTVFAHNVVLEAGNPETINGWDGWALWGDINITRVMYLGNTTAHNKEAGLYVEWGMADTRAYFNTSLQDGHGITCRASQRGVFMHNVVQSPRSSGLSIWDAVEPYRTIDNVFAHNLVRDADLSLRLGIEQPEFADYNTYWPRAGKPFGDGEKQRPFKTIEELRAATGHELHGEVRDAQPADLGLAPVTFHVPDAHEPGEVLSMVGNGGCEWYDPAGVNILPYFWRAGTGDGAEHVFVYSAYTGLPGGCEAFAYSGAGGTLAQQSDGKTAHGGVRCLEINGIRPEQIPAEGLGFRSPTLPARPGDTLEVSFWVRGRDLAAAGGPAQAAFAEFSSQTGQRRSRLNLLNEAKGLSGTFDWTQITATVQVPETARRVAFFLGLGKATGTVWYDDIALGVRQP